MKLLSTLKRLAALLSGSRGGLRLGHSLFPHRPRTLHHVVCCPFLLTHDGHGGMSTKPSTRVVLVVCALLALESRSVVYNAG